MQTRELINLLKDKLNSPSVSKADCFNDMVAILVSMVILLKLTENDELNQFCKDLDSQAHEWVEQLRHFSGIGDVQSVNRIMREVRSKNIFLDIFKVIATADLTAFPGAEQLPAQIITIWNDYFCECALTGYKNSLYFQSRSSLNTLLQQTEDPWLSMVLLHELFNHERVYGKHAGHGLFKPASDAGQLLKPAGSEATVSGMHGYTT